MLRDVVSGPLDADKQDYLLRDSYFCGVKYGVFDLQQLHREFTVVSDPTDGKHLMITAHGVNALEQFVLAKHYLTAQVYKHRVRLITDQMIVRAIVLGRPRSVHYFVLSLSLADRPTTTMVCLDFTARGRARRTRNRSHVHDGW